jgi:hypothetical protein
MEDQATGEAQRQDRLEETRERLLKRPSLLWTLPDDL